MIVLESLWSPIQQPMAEGAADPLEWLVHAAAGSAQRGKAALLMYGPGKGVVRAPFSKEENEHTYRNAHLRIHDERMMRMMRTIKGRWRVFDRPIPVHRIPAMGRRGHIVSNLSQPV